MSDNPADHHADFIAWCRAERANALKNIEIIDRGDFRVGFDVPDAIPTVQSPGLRATYERIFAQMEHLLKAHGSA